MTYSEEAAEQARKNLKYRKNGREYKDKLYKITGSVEDSEKPYEVFAYAIETHMGGVKDDISDEIFRLATKEEE